TSEQLFSFVFVGAGTARKGFDFLLDAMEVLLSEGLSFRLLVAGIIDRSLLKGRKRLLKRIREYGMVSHDELPSMLRSAHCLVLPSRFDAFGMVVAEAIACGTPVIVSNMVGAKELVQDGRNGFIVPVGNLDVLVDRMRRCVINPGLAKKMSIAARATAQRVG